VTAAPLEAALAGDSADARALAAILGRMAALGIERHALLLRRGPTVRAILYVAGQEQADLIITGSRHALTYFPGSVANAVVQLAPCPVLVAHPPAS
jgi:nucleotide-binding universal stress UspA family protein